MDLPVDNTELLEDITIDVYDKDVGAKDDFLGRCKVSKTTIRTAITTGQRQDVWKMLQDVDTGTLHASVSWCELQLKPTTPPLASAIDGIDVKSRSCH